MSKDESLRKLNAVSSELLQPLGFSQMVEHVVHTGIKLLEADEGSLILNKNEQLERVYSTADYFNTWSIRKKGYIHECYQTHTPLIVDVETLLPYQPTLKTANVQTVFFIPLSYQRKSIGVLSIHSKKIVQKTNENTTEMLKLFGSIASLALRKTELNVTSTTALQSRDRFISMAAHELKTPLTTINGYVQLLDKKITNLEQPEARWVDNLLIETKRMVRLIDEFLQVNQIKSRKMRYVWKEERLSEVVESTLECFIEDHPDSKVSFTYNTKELSGVDTVVADKEKLCQALLSLLENASEVSPDGSQIQVKLHAKDPYLVIEIEDHGPGISKSELTEIFKEYYKGSTSSKEQGLGIGLFLVKTIIEDHQGHISIKSVENKGTRIQIKLKPID